VLLDRAVRRAFEKGTVHFDLTLRFSAEAPESALRRLAKAISVPGDAFLSLARRPLCVAATGDRSPQGFKARGRIEAGGKIRDFELRLTPDGGLFVHAEGRWSGLPTGDGLFTSETVGGLVPISACVREESEGCDRVDFGPPVRSGIVGRLVDGRVGEGGDGTWKLVGRPNPDEVARLVGGPPSSYDPYEQFGKVVLVVARSDGLPRRLDVSYDFDEDAVRQHSRSSSGPFTGRSGHVSLVFSRWGERFAAAQPSGAGVGQAEAQRLFRWLLEAVVLYY
jgi:hypothetical protein